MPTDRDSGAAPSGFDGFVAAELPGLLRYAVMLTGQPDLASDVVQDVLVKVYRKWERIGASDHPDRYVPVTMPFDLGWLPSGRVEYGARRINIGGISDLSKPAFNGEYLLTVHGSKDVDIDVQQMAGGLSAAGFKSGGGRHVSIDGRPGYESTHSGGPAGYEIYFETSAGLVYVSAGPQFGGSRHPAPTGAELAAIGRHVARAVSFPGTTRLEPSFNIGYVPAGAKVNAFDLENSNYLSSQVKGELRGTTISYEIGSPHDQIQKFEVRESVSAKHGRSGRNVQGHRTMIGTGSKGFHSVTVLDAVDGHAVEVDGVAAYTVLYKIADGLILPH